MSTAYSSAKQQYIGNGVTTEWGFDFPIKKHSELKVYLKRSNSTQVLLEEGVDYSFVTENTITFPIKTGEAKLQATDVLALQRESVFESEYNFSNQQRLEPEEVMHADDNLERQIQELKRDVTQAIRIQPTSNIDTDEYFIAVESIYENLDNITNVSGISAEIVNCSDNISDISTVSSNISNVNAVGQSISSVNTVASNVSSVNTVAGVSTDVTTVAGISTDVSTVANNDANVTTVATNISDVNTAATNIEAIKDAPNQASSAQNSANTAQTMATQAAQSAQTAENKADEASESARLAVSALSLQIGDIGFAPLGIDESLNLRRYLNGQVINQSQFVAFTNKVKAAIALFPSLSATEENWQAEKTNSKLGQCGKFVVDDTAGTIRLPCIVNSQGLVDLALIGGIKSESLPNIKGSCTSYELGTYHGNMQNGALGITQSAERGVSGHGSQAVNINLDASKYSPTYQDNAPVQQEAVQYPYYIQVATGIEETLPAIREYNINTPFFFGQSMYSDVAPDNASWLVSNGQYNAKTVYPDYYDWLLTRYNNPTESNVVKSGSLADNNGVLSVFSASNYVKLPSAFSPNSDAWEVVCKITTGNDVSTFQSIIDGVGSTSVAFSIYSSKTRLYISSNSSTWDISDGILGTYTVLANTTYYVKIAYNGSSYTLSYSTDGETYTTDITVSSSTPIYGNVTLELGVAYGTTAPANPFLGSIDLNESHININGQRWWNGRKAIVIKTGETSVSPDYDWVVNTADETFRLPIVAGRVLVAKKEPTTEDQRWYSLYSDGWLEQGGYSFPATSTVSFLKQFSDNNYTLLTQPCDKASTSSPASYMATFNHTVSGFSALANLIITGYEWQACGYAEIPAQSEFAEVSGLYYYVGDTVQDSSLINAGAVLGQLSDKISRTAASDREMVVSWGMPDYETDVTGSQPGSGSWTKVNYDAFVVSFGTDPRIENYDVKVSPDNGTTSYIVGHRSDDHDAYTQSTSFTFFVPAGWYFRNYCESGSTYHIYKLKGAN